MLFRSVFIAALSLTPILCSPSPSHGKYKPKGGKHCGSDDDLTIVDKYFEFWDGNGSLLNEIFSPGLTVYQDRLPTANGSATYPLFTREAYGEWWRLSREGYDPYRFTRLYDLRQGDKAVVRWTLDATLVDPQLALPGVTVPAGTHVGYNGTDVLYINEETGLIDVIDSAQDFITYFNALGFKSINV